jgi:hypothetical protein
MTVEIPENLSNKLTGLGPHFIRVSSKGKEPVDKGWTTSPLSADDLKLQKWLENGRNYGVIGGFGLVIVDIDSEELKDIVKEGLPSTFTVQSPGSKGYHLYYVCSLEKPIRLRDKDGENIGDIQGQGKMVVGPGSMHPNGGVYKIIDDRALAQITRQQLLNAFSEFVVSDNEIEKSEAAASWEKRETNIELDILQVIPLASLKKQGNEYFGVHPLHDSKTGRNFWINPSKNTWHCFRHGSGGGPWLWLAIEEGIINCEDACSGALRGGDFKKVIAIARERGLIKDRKKRKKRETKNKKAERPEDVLDKFLLTPPLSQEQLEKLKPAVDEKLVDPEQLLWVDDVLGTRIVGESRNRSLTFFTGLSYKTGWKLALVFIAEPSAGKSYVSRNVLRYFPNVIKFSRMTPKALERCQANLDKHILYIVELQGAIEWMPQLRELISEGELALLSVEKNDGDNLEITPIKTVGTPVFVSTTAKTTIEQQLCDRVILASPDTSEEQTGRIFLHRAHEDMSPKLPEFTEDEMVLRALVELIPPVEYVFIPYGEEIARIFPTNLLRGRRDFNKLMDIVKTITCLYQKQRQTIEIDGKSYLLSSLVDLEYAFLILEDAIRTTVASLPQTALEIMDAIEFQSEKIELTAKEIGDLIDKQRVTVSKYLPKLVEFGLLSCDDSTKPYKYSLVEILRNPGICFFESLREELGSFGLEGFKKFVNQLVSMSPEQVEALYNEWSKRREPVIVYDKKLGVFTRNTETTQSGQENTLSRENKAESCVTNTRKHSSDEILTRGEKDD